MEEGTYSRGIRGRVRGCVARVTARLPRASRRPSSCPPVRISWSGTLANERTHTRARCTRSTLFRQSRVDASRAARFLSIQSVTSGQRRIVIYSLVLFVVAKSPTHYQLLLIARERFAPSYERSSRLSIRFDISETLKERRVCLEETKEI